MMQDRFCQRCAEFTAENCLQCFDIFFPWNASYEVLKASRFVEENERNLRCNIENREYARSAHLISSPSSLKESIDVDSLEVVGKTQYVNLKLDGKERPISDTSRKEPEKHLNGSNKVKLIDGGFSARICQCCFFPLNKLIKHHDFILGCGCSFHVECITVFVRTAIQNRKQILGSIKLQKMKTVKS